MKTRLEVIQYAARRLGVLAEDESLSSASEAMIGEALDSLFEEISLEAAPTWDLTTVDDAAFVQLGNLLAAEVAPMFGVSGGSRSGHWLRLMAQIRPDNRTAVDAVYY